GRGGGARGVETRGGLNPPRRQQRGVRRERDFAVDIRTLVERFSLQVLQPLSQPSAQQTSDCTSEITRLAGDLAGRAEAAGKPSRHDERIRPAGGRGGAAG